MGFDLVATGGTCQLLREHGLYCERVNKVAEGRPHIVDKIKSNEIDFIINTTEGAQATAHATATTSNRFIIKYLLCLPCVVPCPLDAHPITGALRV